MEEFRKAHPDVRVNWRDDYIAVEGPPEEVELVRAQIQTIVDEIRQKNTTYLEVEIDPQFHKQLIGKNQARLHEFQEQSGCDIKFPYDDGRMVKLIGTQESVQKARQILLERVQKLANEHTADLTIDPQYYPQLIGAKGKNLEEVRSKFHNIQITFPEVNGNSNKVTLHGDKDDVEKCSKYLQQKFKDLHSVEIDVPKRLYPMLIGKSGANIQRLREKIPDVRIDVPSIDDTKDATHIRLNGKKADVEKAVKLLEEHIAQLNTSMENSVEQHIAIDPKWHSRFFQNKRKLLTDLQQQYGDMLIKLPERNTNSDQVLLRGPKDAIEQVRKRLEELTDTWENTITKEMTISHRHHGYLLAQSGAHIQPVQKEFNVQIKFPPRGNNQKDEQQQPQEATTPDENKQDIVRLTGRPEDIDKAMLALEKMIPVESTVDIPYEAHGALVGKGGSNLQSLIKQYPGVQITFPPVNSSQNTIQLRGQREQVEGVRKELLESYEKYQVDRQARSFEVRFTVKPEYRSLIFGIRGRTINSLRQKHDVKIDVTNNQAPSTAIVPAPTTANEEDNQPAGEQLDDQQATPQENVILPSETNNSTAAASDVEIVITGHEEQALACRDDILQSIKEFEAKITMEIEIDSRVHARIIGSGGQKLQQLMKDYSVEIRFQANNQSDKVHVIGLEQEKIDACIDQLLVLEEDYLQDLPYRPSGNAPNASESTLGQQVSNVQQQEVPSTNTVRAPKNENHYNKNKQQRQAPFQVKNAPWTNGNENETDPQQKHSRQRNGHENSPRKATPLAPSRDDLGKSNDRRTVACTVRLLSGEYPSFSNGMPMTTDDAPLPVQQQQQQQQPTVNTLPIIWGPQRRNK